jgi:hypothetical protein
MGGKRNNKAQKGDGDQLEGYSLKKEEKVFFVSHKKIIGCSLQFGETL